MCVARRTESKHRQNTLNVSSHPRRVGQRQSTVSDVNVLYILRVYLCVFLNAEQCNPFKK